MRPSQVLDALIGAPHCSLRSLRVHYLLVLLVDLPHTPDSSHQTSPRRTREDANTICVFLEPSPPTPLRGKSQLGNDDEAIMHNCD